MIRPNEHKSVSFLLVLSTSVLEGHDTQSDLTLWETADETSCSFVRFWDVLFKIEPSLAFASVAEAA